MTILASVETITLDWSEYIPIISLISTLFISPLITLFIGKSLGIFNNQLTENREESKYVLALERENAELKMQKTLLDAISQSEKSIQNSLKEVKNELKSDITGVETRLSDEISNLATQIDGVADSFRTELTNYQKVAA